MGFFMKQYIFYLEDKPLYCYIWNTHERPIGVVQIIRDNSENLFQYNKLAEFLDKNGYIVFGKYQDNKNTKSNIFEEIEIFNFLRLKFYLPMFLLANNSDKTTQTIIKSIPNCSGTCIIKNKIKLKDKIQNLFGNKLRAEMEICEKSPILIIDKIKKLDSINDNLSNNIKADFQHSFLQNLNIKLYNKNATDDEYNYAKNDILRFFNTTKYK